MEVHQKKAEPWGINLVDRHEGRPNQACEYLRDEAFHFTYGDGLAYMDIAALIARHKPHGRLATVTAVQPPGRCGVLEFVRNAIVSGF